ncbi:hypothetical protein GQ607_014665 [Colletotrichum asianum]|uniref:Uncharacterized protein n=1 Tax=Colletotrichum asianum TaxID=702518 RepID=A0A8H3W1G7_9PEZI|nr:hypothetical protein GQ607_014665 [Colletotrichum asianum]
MPPGSFALVLTGGPSCTKAFQTVIMRDAAWQMAMHERSRQGLLPPLSWEHRRRLCLSNDDPWCLLENYSQAIPNIVNGSSIIRCDFDTGKFWDENQLVEFNKQSLTECNIAQWSLLDWIWNWKRQHNTDIVPEN